MLRWRWTIVSFGFAGGLLGLAISLLGPKVFVSSASFIPQAAESGGGIAALAASQFGIRMPAGGGGTWGAPMYVELVKSHTLLEPIARDSFAVTSGGPRLPLVDVVRAVAPTPELRVEEAIKTLRTILVAREDKRLGMVTVKATTRSPELSYALVDRLIKRLNQFNLETRKSQALAERQLAEREAALAEAALRAAEDRLLSFRQTNRIRVSDALRAEEDRLQRDVATRNQLYNSWLQSREEARIREVRDTPVLTIVETPRVPLLREGRGTVRKAVLGGLIFGGIAALFAIITEGFSRRDASPETREFVSQLQKALPRFMRPRHRIS